MAESNIEQIIEKLKSLPCEAWELTETAEERWEFYFIGHRLDQNRAVKTRETGVRIFVASEDGAFIGSASDVIDPTATEEEIEATLARLTGQAALVRNPYYTLTDRPIEGAGCPGDGAAQAESPDPARIAGDYIRAFADIPETAGRKLNSYEIFTSVITRRTLNSNGVAFTHTYPATELEVIVNAEEDGHEVELYRIYKSGTCDRDALIRNVGRVMDFGEDRLRAVPTPKLGSCDVLLSTQDAGEVYQYFADRMHADYVFRKMSDVVLGKPVTEHAGGDRISLEAVPFLPNSSMNYPVDREGAEIRARYLIRDGIAEAYCGSRQFSEYLGIRDSSLLTNYRISGGSSSEEELRAGDYLEIVEFSDFSVDSMSGDIAGEIRLGYWHHGGEVMIVTGGSISGSMGEAAKTMRFSKETVQYNNREIPSVTILKNLRITGVAPSD